MTDARLVSKTPEGSGLTHGMLDQLYERRHKGMPIDAIPVVGLLKVAGSGEHDTAKGATRHVKLEFLRLEPVKDPGEAEEIAWQITRAYERRTSPSGQSEFPVSNSPAEKRRGLLEELNDWREANSLSEEELDKMWVAHFGGPEYAAAEHARDGSLVHLLEFVGYCTTELGTPKPEKKGKGKKAPGQVAFIGGNVDADGQPVEAKAGVKDGSPEPAVTP